MKGRSLAWCFCSMLFFVSVYTTCIGYLLQLTWEALNNVLKWKLEMSQTTALPRLGTGLSLLMFSPICGTDAKSKMECLAHTGERERERKGEGRGSITWTQLLRLTTAIHHLHPPTTPRQRSYPRIWVCFPARSARHSVIPKRALLAPNENLIGILKTTFTLRLLILIVFFFPRMSVTSSTSRCRWATLDSQASGGV